MRSEALSMQRFTTNPPVFFGASAIILCFVLFGALAPEQAETVFGQMQGWILHRFGWFYLLAVAVFLIAVLILGLSRFGALKLGPDDSEPDFPFASWVAMLFAAGMGIGLMFFAVGEPMTHFVAPPEAEAHSIAASRQAMAITFFHWGIHAWAIYAVVGLSLAYFGYRYKLPLAIRSGLYPLLRERINGPWGHAVDIFAICGTIFGIATSLGLGVLQINAGLNHIADVPISPFTQIVLVAVIASIAGASAVSGVHRGVRRLSELNLLLAIGLMAFVLLAGPTSQLLSSFVQNIGLYLDSILLRTFNIYAYQPIPWIESWTLFYWAWWISWAPYVGMFIARISRGRTVRQFVLSVLFIPAGFTFMWMTVFGNTAMHIDTTIAAGALGEAVIADVSVGLFRFFEYLPLPMLTSIVAVTLVAVFFVTSADSGALVVDTIAAGGRTDTPTIQRLYWCAMIGVVSAVLLLAGGLEALQTVTIASALPFTVVMLILIWSLFRGMNADLACRSAAPARPAAGLPWQRRLSLLLHSPTEADIRRFIQTDVDQAFATVASELDSRGRAAVIEHNPSKGEVSLVVAAEGGRSFVYGVRPCSQRLPVFSATEIDNQSTSHEARTFFGDGSRGYDVMGFTRDQIIGDVLAQYDRYLALVQSPRTQLYATAPDPA
jgi:choline/glycine/proline betaine transport protein